MIKHPNAAVNVNSVLYSRGSTVITRTFFSTFAEEPNEIELERCPIAIPAHVAFSPNELDARIAVYAELVERGLPLFEGDQADGKDATWNTCWGCGAGTPTRRDGTRVSAFRADGWVMRRLMPGWHVRETWCPGCAEMRGFGCVEEEDGE